MSAPHPKITLSALQHALGAALRLVWRSAPQLAAGQTALAFCQALLPLVVLWALRQGVDAATLAVAQAHNQSAHSLPMLLAQPEAQRLALWLLVGAIAVGAQVVLRALSSWLAEQHAMAVSDAIHRRLHEYLAAADLALFENSAAQDRLHLVQSQAMTEPIRVLDAIFAALYGVVALLGVLALLAGVHPVLPLALLLGGLPALLWRLQRSRRLFIWRRDLAPLERAAGYFHTILTDSTYAQEIRLYGHANFCRERFEKVRTRLRFERRRWRRYLLSRELVLQAFALALLAVALAWLSGRLLAGALTLGGLVMTVQALQRGQSQTTALAGTLGEGYQSLLFFQLFEDFLAQPAQVVAPPRPHLVPRPLQQGIVFEKVTFTYPGTARPVLREVSFTLPARGTLALVGANGAGKSTIIKLLARLYDPTTGRILADGIDLREFDPVQWRSRLGLLFQDFGRYQLTAAENIWIGDPQGEPNQTQIAAVAARAGLAETLQTWPQGIETPLGRWLHAGVEPSVGQWQRIALGRALLRDAELLMLDEPTSALDERQRRALVGRLRELAAGRTMLLASHRLALAGWAERIVVLRDGAVAESGSAAELLRRNSEFARLFKDGEDSDES